MNEQLCYLCGQPIEKNVSRDHVPPSQFFTKLFRQNRSPNLLTLPAHTKCNKSYQSDEDYFFVALAGLNENVQIRDWLIDDIRKKFGERMLTGYVKQYYQSLAQRFPAYTSPTV